MRVLHVDTGREWRGGQRQVHLLAAGLRARGDEPLVVVTPRSALHLQLRSAGIAVVAIPMRSQLDVLAVRRLRRLIATWKPAIVHAHDARGHALAMSALVGRASRIPLVVTRRTPVAPRGLLRFERRSSFIAISGKVREALADDGVAASRVALVYPGVSRPEDVTKRDWRTECGWPADAIIGGVIGEFASPRGLPTVEAIAAALPEATRLRVRFVVLGGRGSGQTSIGGVAAFRAGYVHDIHRAIAGLDLMLHSGTTEGLGTAVIDAMALGVPCIAFGGGSVSEIIDAGTNGLLIPAGDTGAFARALSELACQPEYRARLVEGGRNGADRFGAARFVDGVTAVYRDLLKRSMV